MSKIILKFHFSISTSSHFYFIFTSWSRFPVISISLSFLWVIGNKISPFFLEKKTHSRRTLRSWTNCHIKLFTKPFALIWWHWSYESRPIHPAGNTKEWSNRGWPCLQHIRPPRCPPKRRSVCCTYYQTTRSMAPGTMVTFCCWLDVVMVNYITHQQSAIVRVLYLLSDHKRSDLWVPHLPLICNLFLSDVVAADYGNTKLPVCEYNHVCAFNTMPRTAFLV